MYDPYGILDDAGPYSIIDEHDGHKGLFAVSNGSDKTRVIRFEFCQ